MEQGDIVIFKRYSDILGKEDYQDGYVIADYHDKNEVDICWLEGYKSRVDSVKYENIVTEDNVENI